MDEQYVYELEHALEELLAFFIPGNNTYDIETLDEGVVEVPEEMAQAVDRANDVLYGESGE